MHQVLVYLKFLPEHNISSQGLYSSGYSVVCRWLTAFQPWQIIMSG
nr:MAG TPA: hypothetical protein [Caudoviricetes sp.]